MQNRNWLGWILCCATLILCTGYTLLRPVQLYRITEGKIHFKSDAPLELIEASSTKLKGLIKTEDQTFAFSVANESFEGFNSALQREHFNENYMESNRYPNCTFSGKIIEPVDFTKNGMYSVRAKGKLSVHGVDVERIIKSTITIKDGEIKVNSSFIVPLQEHNITIPKVVYQKIAEEINVEISATLTPQK
ncbi:YceI family protein [Pontibacter sp. H259]|uniref:YceI family protein n=1 Tax=Pontibacter sp. H259 TaxID=3133421 RepID=UPI0030BB0660